MERKTFLRGALGVAALSISGCNKSGQRRVAVVPKGLAHLFWQSVHAGANKAAREHSIEVLWKGPASETDYNGQIQIVDAMINQRVDAICLAPIDKTVMLSVVERAAKEKIPVVIFDSGIDTESYAAMVATDNYAAGQLAAARMGEILGGKGEVVVVAVQPGGASTMAREQGFEDAIKKFPGIQIKDKRYGMADFAKSLQVAENMLTAFPNVNGLFASNESSAVGAARALKGRKSSTVKMVGFDWSPTLLEDLRSGLIDSLVAQDPFQMGYRSMIAAVDKLDGKPVEKNQPLPPRLITKSNIDSPEVKAQLEPDLKKYLD
ncbi:MAG: substrate-binding domain-containing protein [Bryobacterales bacterium]|nr:substrate-binding domain-containing protein [Bryobacterales bacterium]